MVDNLIYFSKEKDTKGSDINMESAMGYFVENVLPYAGKNSLLRLIQANQDGDIQAIKLEMTRLFIEAEIMRPAEANVTSPLKGYFTK